MVDALEAMNINISGVEAEGHSADALHLLACPTSFERRVLTCIGRRAAQALPVVPLRAAAAV